MVDDDVWGAAAQVRTADRWHFAAANWNAVLTQALLDSANLTPSCLVIDVAAGSGDPALSIIKRLREGRVIAIDSSRPGLLLAQRQGDDLGLGSKLLTAPERLLPPSRWPVANLLNEFDAARRRTIEFATTAADTKELRHYFMQHPFFGELDCYQWFILAAGHSARHCNQCAAIKESAGFPR